MKQRPSFNSVWILAMLIEDAVSCVTRLGEHARTDYYLILMQHQFFEVGCFVSTAV